MWEQSFFDIWCVGVWGRFEKESRSRFAKENFSFIPWIAVDHKIKTLKNFIVSTKFFQCSKLTVGYSSKTSKISQKTSKILS